MEHNTSPSIDIFLSMMAKVLNVTQKVTFLTNTMPPFQHLWNFQCGCNHDSLESPPRLLLTPLQWIQNNKTPHKITLLYT